MLEKIDQVIKQALRDESNDQAFVNLMIKFLDYRRRWKVHSSEYPLIDYIWIKVKLGTVYS